MKKQAKKGGIFWKFLHVFRKLLGLVRQKWVSQKVHRGLFESAEGRIPEEGKMALLGNTHKIYNICGFIFQGFPATSAGFMVLACVFFMAPFTGCSLNPARSFAPAMIMLDFADYHWIYYVGPVSGGLIAVALYYTMFIQGIHQFDDPPEDNTSENHELQPKQKSNGSSEVP